MNPFFKPLSSQRYFDAITRALQSKAEFIIDFGCAECDFLFYVSRRPETLRFAIGVDKDSFVLKKGQRALTGGSVVYKHPRPFQVALLQEDITALSDRFVSQYQFCPFVTALELIEHLELSDVEKAMEQIFGRLKPKCVYLTTPNIEYNDLLKESFGRDRHISGFRHRDHKFEWTRSEFQQWCESVTKRYPYKCEIGGVGKIVSGDDGTKGHASHSAFFMSCESIEKEFTVPEDPLYFTVIDVDAIENYLPGFTPEPTPEPSQEEYDTFSTEESGYNSPAPYQ